MVNFISQPGPHRARLVLVPIFAFALLQGHSELATADDGPAPYEPSMIDHGVNSEPNPYL